MGTFIEDYLQDPAGAISSALDQLNRTNRFEQIDDDFQAFEGLIFSLFFYFTTFTTFEIFPAPTCENLRPDKKGFFNHFLIRFLTGFGPISHTNALPR